MVGPSPTIPQLYEYNDVQRNNSTQQDGCTNMIYIYMFKVNNSKSCCFLDHVSANINKLWLVLCYLRVSFHQLASPPGFNVSHNLKGNLVYIYMNVFFLPFGIFFSSGRGSFLVFSSSVARREPARTPCASLGPGRGPVSYTHLTLPTICSV